MNDCINNKYIDQLHQRAHQKEAIKGEHHGL